MEKNLYECNFYLMDDSGKKITEYLTTYIEAEYSRYAENILIATYANGDRKKIWFSTLQTVRDREKLIREMWYVYYQFITVNDEKGKQIGYFMDDIIMAKDSHKADLLLIAKYANGNPKRVKHPTGHSYRYEELYKISSKYETYEFTFYLKDNKGQKASEMMTIMVDDVSYFKAEQKLITMVADGNRDRVWHSSGRTIGLALPSLLREQFFEEQRKEQIRREKEKEEKRKEEILRREKEREEIRQRIEEERKAKAEHISSLAEEKPSKTELKQSLSTNSNNKSNLALSQKTSSKRNTKTSSSRKTQTAQKTSNEKRKKTSNIKADDFFKDDTSEEVIENNNAKDKKHIFQNIVIFSICFLLADIVISESHITTNKYVSLGIIIWYLLLLSYVRKRFRLILWSPVLVSIVLFIAFFFLT